MSSCRATNAKAATAAPWFEGQREDGTVRDDPGNVICDCFASSMANARLIVAMRNALPELLAVARAADAVAAVACPADFGDTTYEVDGGLVVDLRAALAALGVKA